MNKQMILLAAGAVFIVLAGCKDKREAEDPMPRIYFTGITERDPFGSPLGGYDTTDWRLDDVWIAQEEALFPADDIPLCASAVDTLEIFSAQPNPVKEVSHIGLRNLANASWHFRLVDENFQVLWTADFTDFRPNYNSIRLETTDFPKDTLRLYYQVERANCQWRGHGDILIKP